MALKTISEDNSPTKAHQALEMHVVGAERGASVLSFLARLPLLSERPAAAYALATALVAAAWYLWFALDPLFPPGFPYLTFFPAVTLSTFLLGWRAAT